MIVMMAPVHDLGKDVNVSHCAPTGGYAVTGLRRDRAAGSREREAGEMISALSLSDSRAGAGTRTADHIPERERGSDKREKAPH